MSDSDTSWISTSTSEFCSSDDETEMDIETEILQTIQSDPELLMKIIEKSKTLDIPLGTLLEDLQKLNKPTPEKTTKRQKGILDIQPVKLEEARKGTRKTTNKNNNK